MKTRHFAAAIFGLLFGVILQSYGQSENAVLGHWLTADKTAQIAIQKTGTNYIGKVIWLKDPTVDGEPLTDKNNEDPKLRNRPINGLVLISGLTYEKGMWKNGEIYDPKTGKTYSCEIRLPSADILELRGYLGFSFVGKTVEWTRVK